MVNNDNNTLHFLLREKQLATTGNSCGVIAVLLQNIPTDETNFFIWILYKDVY